PNGQFVFQANVAGNANNTTDDGIVVQNLNSKKWNTVKFLFSNGGQAGAVGVGNSQSGVGADTGNTTNTYYVLVGFFEGPGFDYVQNEKIMGGWIRNGTDLSGDFLLYYHPNGTGFDSTTDNITNMLSQR